MSVVQPSSTSAPLKGSVLVLIQFDVCEELLLDRLQQTVSARTVQLPSMKHSAPAYVRYQRPPIVERLYKLAAGKVGVPDYRNLVERKLKTADDLYNYMVEQFNQSRAFFLEVTVVLILLIELFYLFKGKAL